jgi:hypothetical protein
VVLSRHFEPPDLVTATLGGVVTTEDQIELVGIFGDPEWKPAMLTLMAQPVRRVPIAYFATEAAARRWLEPSRAAARAAS